MRRTVNQKELTEEMGNWLGQFPWDAFATWTFARPATTNAAMFWAKKHISWLEKAAEQRVYGFVATDKGQNGGLIHLHALLGNVKHMQFFCGRRYPPNEWGQKCCLTHAWPCGYARVYPYDPALDAKHYVAKYVAKDSAEWDIFGDPTVSQTAFAHKGSEFC
jgi:hypothetical protein